MILKKSEKLFNKTLKENKIYLIIAPPRSGSTLIEKVLSNSKSIDLDIHEPFMEFGRRNEDLAKTYKIISEKIFNNSKSKNKQILIKEMSHDIIKKNIFKKLIKLTNKKIILNIRNPLFCIESRIISMLKASPIALKESTKKFIENSLKKEFGIKSMKYKLDRILLNEYAKIKGFDSWKDYIEFFIKKRDYREFEDFLISDEKRFMTGFGWEELYKIKKYLESKKLDLIIIDYAEFVKKPKKYTKALCYLWNIKYDKGMFKWEKGSYEHIGKIWYSAINNSVTVNKPKKKIIDIKKLPNSVQIYLKKIAIPIYKKLYKERLKK